MSINISWRCCLAPLTYQGMGRRLSSTGVWAALPAGPGTNVIAYGRDLRFCFAAQLLRTPMAAADVKRVQADEVGRLCGSVGDYRRR